MWAARAGGADFRRARVLDRLRREGWAIAALLVLAQGAAHAQPAQPTDQGWHYEHWQGWHGEMRPQGSTSDWDTYGPNGQHRHCHRYFVDDTATTVVSAPFQAGAI